MLSTELIFYPASVVEPAFQEMGVTQPYALHSDQECQRLEAQATLARLDGHLRHLRVPDQARILDAGCGTGSMSRLLGRAYPNASVVGMDLNADYLAYARKLTATEGLRNVTFQDGDLRALPFASASFDLIWSKYVLFFVPEPLDALAEFHRTTKQGGTVVVVLNDWAGIVLSPPDESIQQRLQSIANRVIHLSLPTQLPSMTLQCGFADVSVELETDKVLTCTGSIDPQSRWNHLTELTAAMPYAVEALGSQAAYDIFVADWFGYLDRPDTCTILPLWFVQGIAT